MNAERRLRSGKAGAYCFGIASGIDYRPVRANRIRKSVGAENTFSEDLFDYDSMREALQSILNKVWRHCEVHGTRGRTVTLTVKFSDFTRRTTADDVRRLRPRETTTKVVAAGVT